MFESEFGADVIAALRGRKATTTKSNATRNRNRGQCFFAKIFHINATKMPRRENHLLGHFLWIRSRVASNSRGGLWLPLLPCGAKQGVVCFSLPEGGVLPAGNRQNGRSPRAVYASGEKEKALSGHSSNSAAKRQNRRPSSASDASTVMVTVCWPDAGVSS